MKRLIPTLLVCCVLLISVAAAQILNSPPPIVPQGSTSTAATLFQPCVPTGTQGGSGFIAPCGANAVVTPRTITASTGTFVTRLNTLPTIPAGQSTITIKLLGPASSSITLTNVCIGTGAGTQQYQFGTVAGTCNGSNGCTKICSAGGGAPTCSAITSAGLTLPTTSFTPGSNLLIAVDHASTSVSRPSVQAISTSSSTINYFPGNTILANQYNVYSKGGQEACSVLKTTTGWGVNFGTTGQNWTGWISKVSVQ